MAYEVFKKIESKKNISTTTIQLDVVQLYNDRSFIIPAHSILWPCLYDMNKNALYTYNSCPTYRDIVYKTNDASWYKFVVLPLYTNGVVHIFPKLQYLNYCCGIFFSLATSDTSVTAWNSTIRYL